MEFSLESHGEVGCRQFAEWLSTRFGVHSSVVATRQYGRLVGYHLGIFRRKDIERLIGVIEPYVPDCMRRKIEGSVHACKIPGAYVELKGIENPL